MLWKLELRMLPTPDSIAQSTRPFFLLTQLPGLCPVSASRISFAVSRARVVMTIAMCVVFVALAGRPVMDLRSTEQEVLKRAGHVYRVAGGNVIVVAVWITTVLTCHRFSRTLAAMVHIDRDFTQLNISLNHVSAMWATSLSFLLGMASLVSLCLLDFLVLADLTFTLKTLLMRTLDYLYWYCDMFVCYAATLHFVWATLYCWHRYRLLNEHLEVLLERRSRDGNVMLVESVGKNQTRKDNTLLAEVRSIHLHLFTLSNKLDEVLGHKALLLIFHCYFMLLIEVYILCIELMRNEPDIQSLVLSFVWLAMFSGLILAHVLPCTATMSQIDRTSTIVFDMMTRIQEAGLREELQVFSQQLLQRKPSFTVLGLFPLDNGLLLSVFASIASYVVVMIQFHNISRNQEKSQQTLPTSTMTTSA